jgi:hypothetical protein
MTIKRVTNEEMAGACVIMFAVNVRFLKQSERNGCGVAEILEMDADCAGFISRRSGRFPSAGRKASQRANHEAEASREQDCELGVNQPPCIIA